MFKRVITTKEFHDILLERSKKHKEMFEKKITELKGGKENETLVKG